MMVVQRKCGVCSKPLTNFIDSHEARFYPFSTYGGSKAEFSITLCYKHHTVFFLDGQIRFLKNFKPQIINWLYANGKSSIVSRLEETLNSYDRMLQRQNENTFSGL